SASRRSPFPVLRKQEAHSWARQESLLLARSCGPESPPVELASVELASAQEPASLALTVVSATVGKGQQAWPVPGQSPAPVARRSRPAGSPVRRPQRGAPAVSGALHGLGPPPA